MCNKSSDEPVDAIVVKCYICFIKLKIILYYTMYVNLRVHALWIKSLYATFLLTNLIVVVFFNFVNGIKNKMHKNVVYQTLNSDETTVHCIR